MLDQTKQRIRQLGEVFTPIPLVQEILNKLPEDVFTDSSKTFLDNSCGNGNFLEQVLLYKLAYQTPKYTKRAKKLLIYEQALNTTFGVDIMADNVVKCRRRLLQVGSTKYLKLPYETIKETFGHIVNTNIIWYDALKYDYSFEEEQILPEEVNNLMWVNHEGE